MTDALTLETRAGLPDALRVLLDEHPRDLWQSHAQYDGLTRFWLERHLMFRMLIDRIGLESRAILDRSAAPDRAVRNTARYAQILLGELHGHHQIEDKHYFPRLVAAEPRLARGFDILDGDHHALDGHLHGLAEATRRLIRAQPADLRDSAGMLDGTLAGFGRFLYRHLVDEEDLVVPILLTHGEALGV
ncbi:hemerythrin domain-containing protein [Rhodovulum euryhalinum]|uniref:Hemerythrin HHE cation binding domain-containing protein n=1 Tax=Rhodovulum euryhalinum TaxID=35805 RepID=A0A4R2K7H6_9RHOB|nr:hemerythrin domain-containing protein [Rhodovulum euryhalinum]TCO69303.1 hemerythrin HHE cation binding domain-containing protein [Rhodovulum euryhalinum]